MPHAFGVKNSVTILRLVRSSLQRLHRYENLQSSHIPEGVAKPALAWLRALHLCLCSRRRCGKRSFTASRTSWRRWWRTLWTWTRTRRNVRSVESLRFAVPGAGRVAIGCSAEFSAGTAASTPETLISERANPFSDQCNRRVCFWESAGPDREYVLHSRGNK